MEEHKPSAEERILEAATKNFVYLGYSGARMQQIANDAGVNKALLHYYFESKEVLFKRVMEDALAGFARISGVLLERDAGSLYQRFRMLTDRFLQIMLRKPFLPGFILQEAQQHPELMYPILQQYHADLKMVQLEIDGEAAAGRMQPTDARELLVNIFSVCFFPFLAMPLISQVLYTGGEEALGKLLDQRRKAVEELVLNRVFEVRG
jgi:TetR/AcrR family transcriptional regulator